MSVPVNRALSPTTAFTIELWALPNTTRPDNGALMSPAASLYRSGSFANGWIFYQGLDYWQFRVGNSTGYKLTLSSQTKPVGGTLYHLVATYDGTTIRLYVNGVQEASGTPSAPIESNANVPLGIGGRGDNAFLFDGTVDEMAVYPAPLTAAEVTAHYQNGLSGSPSPAYDQLVQASGPLAYWRLNEATYTPPPSLPVATNLGSLGSSLDGSYNPGMDGQAAGPRPPTYSGFEAANTAGGFNGAAGYVSTPHTLNDLPAFTVMGWIRRSSLHSGRGGYFGQNDLLEFGDANGGASIEAWINAYGGNIVIGYPFGDNEWGFIALTGDGTKAVLYANGLPVASRDGVVDTYGTSMYNFNIGGGGIFNAAGDYFLGSVDEVAAFDRALTAQEVADIYFSANIAPKIVTEPAAPAGAVYAGASLSLEVIATGTPTLTYQWRRDGGDLQGQTGNKLNISPVQLSDSGRYEVEVRNAYGTVTSRAVTITVQPANPPVITRQPTPSIRFAGGAASFIVEVTGTPPFTYQWQKNGADLGGQTGQTLTLNNLQAGATGDYRVIVKNPIETTGVPSDAARLTVITPSGFSAAALADGPIAYWRLGEAAGTVANDAWRGHDGQYSDAVLGERGYSVLDSDTAARFLPANSSKVVVAAATDFDFSGATPSFTLEAWVKFNNPSGIQRIFSNGQPGSLGYGFGINGAERLRFTTYGVQDMDTDPFEPALVAGKWYHLVAVIDAGVAYTYVNGNPVGAVTWNAAGRPSPSLPFQVSGNPAGTTEFVDGWIDEAVVYDKALGADRVLAHYQARYGSTTQPVFTLEPQSVTVYPTRPATFTAAAEGTEPITYEWIVAGTPEPGANSETLTLTKSAGTYTVICRAASSAGSTDSASATLTVLPNPTDCNLVQDLVLHLKFDNDFQDVSGRGNHGAARGAPTFSVGKIGTRALHYNTDNSSGIYNYVTLGTPADLNLGTSVNFSAAFWVRFTGNPGDLPFLANNDNSMGDVGFTFAPSYNEGGWSWGLNDSVSPRAWPGIGLYDPVQNTINDGAWHHLAHTFDRNGMATTYLDGVKVHEMSITSAAGWNLTTGKPVNIGQGSGTYPENGDFWIDDVGVWHRVLTGLEVDNMYLVGQNLGRPFAPDVSAAPPVLSIIWAGSQLSISWTGSGTLESSTSVAGGWQTAGTASPVLVAPSGAAMFFRVRR